MESTNKSFEQKSSQAGLLQRRPITSCLECYRRKQRCNRRQPCNQCTLRKIPDQCIFSVEKDLLKGTSRKRYVLGRKPHPDGWMPNQTALPNSRAAGIENGLSMVSSDNTQFQLRNRQSDDTASPTRSRSPSDPRYLSRNSYCGLLEQIPSTNVVQALLTFFFKDLYWGAMAVDENRVLSMYEKWRMMRPADHLKKSEDRMQRELQCFAALLFQMLAQALYALPLDHVAAITLGLANQEDIDQLSETYHMNGNWLVQLIGRYQPTLCSVEHDLLAFCWLKNTGRYSEAWYRLGAAVRYCNGPNF